MKVVKKMAAQGDVVFRRVKSLPKGVKHAQESKVITVAHSETGHHHVVEVEGRLSLVHYRSVDPLIDFLEVPPGGAEVKHLREVHRHETLKLPKGVWEVRRQREWAPEGWRPAAD